MLPLLRLSPFTHILQIRSSLGRIGVASSLGPSGGASDASMRDQIQLPPLRGASWGETPPLKLNLVSEGGLTYMTSALA